MRVLAVLLIGFVLAGCGGDDGKKAVAKPNRPNPFSDYRDVIVYAKDWHRISHHNRAIVVAHWAHEAGFTKTQSNAMIWCLKARAEADDAAAIKFPVARKACFEKAKNNKP